MAAVHQYLKLSPNLLRCKNSSKLASQEHSFLHHNGPFCSILNERKCVQYNPRNTPICSTVWLAYCILLCLGAQLLAKDYIKGTDSVPKVGRFGSNYSLIIHEGPCSTSLFCGLLFHADLLQMTKQTWGKSIKRVSFSIVLAIERYANRNGSIKAVFVNFFSKLFVDFRKLDLSPKLLEKFSVFFRYIFSYNLLQKCWTPMKIHVFQKYCPPSPHFNVDCFGELFSSWICVKKPSLQFIQH